MGSRRSRGLRRSVDADEALDSEGFGVFGSSSAAVIHALIGPIFASNDLDIEIGLRGCDRFCDSDVEVEDAVDTCPLWRHEGADTMHATDQSVTLSPLRISRSVGLLMP